MKGRFAPICIGACIADTLVIYVGAHPCVRPRIIGTLEYHAAPRTLYNMILMVKMAYLCGFYISLNPAAI